MESIRRVGPLPFVLLLVGAACVLFTVWNLDPVSSAIDVPSWSAFGTGCVLFIASATLFCVKAAANKPTWAIAGSASVVAALFAIGAYAWLIPARNEPVIFHPALFLQLMNLVWLAIALVWAFRTLNHRN